jgi:hypothetical protein
MVEVGIGMNAHRRVKANTRIQYDCCTGARAMGRSKRSRRGLLKDNTRETGVRVHENGCDVGR